MGIPWVNGGEGDAGLQTHVAQRELKSQVAPCLREGLGDGEAVLVRSTVHRSGPCLVASPLASAATSGEAAQVLANIRSCLAPSPGTLVRPSGKPETPLETCFVNFPCIGGYFQGKVLRYGQADVSHRSRL